MKRYIFSLLFSLLGIVCICAETIDHDGIRYSVASSNNFTLNVYGFVPGYERTRVTIPERFTYKDGRTFTVVAINSYAFRGSESSPNPIEYIELPKTINTIGNEAFNYSNLKELIIPDNVTGLGGQRMMEKLEKLIIGRGISSMPSVLCIHNKRLNYVFIPNSINKFDLSSIAECTIENLVVEDGDGSIATYKTEAGERWRFDGWESIWSNNTEEIVFKISDKYVGWPFFATCSIKNFYVGRNFATDIIEKWQMIRCRPENITVGPKVKTLVGLLDDAMTKTIKLMPTTPPNADEFYDNSYNIIKVFVPKGSLNSYKKHAIWGKFKNIEEYDESCAAPEISYSDGMLKVTSVTQGSICHYTITDKDIVSDVEITGGVQLTGTYEIEAYAVLNGSKSERSYATLCWLDNTFTGTGITQPLGEPKRPVLIKSNGGQIIIEGLEDGEPVDLYTIEGKHLERTSAYGSSATFDTMQQSGQPLILRAGENSIKFIMR